jgi:hypothetical protein
MDIKENIIIKCRGVFYSPDFTEKKKSHEEKQADYLKKLGIGGDDEDTPSIQIRQIPLKQEFGCVYIRLHEIYKLNESDNKDHTVIDLYNDSTIVVDAEHSKISDILKKHGYIIEEI